MKKTIAPITRSSKELIDLLIKIGVIYRGDDNLLYMVEKIPTEPASK